MFNVICLETGLAILDEIGQPETFATGTAASAAAVTISMLTGKKHQPRRVAVADDNAWRERERNKFLTGEYDRLSWDVYWNDSDAYAVEERRYWWFYRNRKPEAEFHFAHASKKEPGKIAFTMSAEHGQADRQTVMSPGRYIRAYYEGLDAHDIRDLATSFSAQYADGQVKFADTQEAIQDVYENGPTSCMSHPDRDYQSHMHPTRVYAAGDLAIAYYETASTEDYDGSITARCVCWPDKKLYSTVYGDGERLKPRLADLGYRRGSLVGAKLLKIRNDYDEDCAGWVMPYLDNSGYVEDMGDHFVIADDGIGAQSTEGFISMGKYCPQCEETVSNSRDFRYIEDQDENWCPSCCSDAAFQSNYDGNWYSDGVMVRMAGGELWTQDQADDDAFCCDYDGEMYPDTDRIDMHDGAAWSRTNFQRHGCVCPECHENVPHCENACPSCQAIIGEPVHVASQGRDESTAQLEMTLQAAPIAPQRPFPVGSRVRIVAGQGWHGDAPIGAEAIVQEYLGREYVHLVWDRRQCNHSQLNGGYFAHYLELVPAFARADEFRQAGYVAEILDEPCFP